GLLFISVTDPEHPEEVGYYDTPGNAHDITVSGDYAYVAVGNSGLCVISVADPERPEEVGYLDTPGYAWGITVSGDYAYVADGLNGLRVISVADPEHPQEVGYYDTPGGALGIALSEDGLIYVADYTNVGIYRFTDPAVVDDSFIPHPSSFILYSPYPNPFNSSVTITYETVQSSFVRLAVYDIRGRLVEELENRRIIKGHHRLTWTHNISGIYFILLETGSTLVVEKIVCVP
ncbi:T9SS type A sorting domain-containing protein, partial [bacterium]|nr:T9SS type A sorting domain-containing protein [bacterium]